MLCIGFVCFLVGALIFGIEFVCFCGTYVGHWVCLFVFVGLMLGIGFVCFFGRGTYVGHWVCLFVFCEFIYIPRKSSFFCKTRISPLRLGNTEEASGHMRKPGLNLGLVGA